MADPVLIAKAAVLLSDKETLKKLLYVLLGLLLLIPMLLAAFVFVIILGVLLILNPPKLSLPSDVFYQTIQSIKSENSIDNVLPVSVVKYTDFIMDGELLENKSEITDFIRQYFVGSKTITVEVEIPVGDPLAGETQTVEREETVYFFLSSEAISAMLERPPFAFAPEDIALIEAAYRMGDDTSETEPLPLPGDGGAGVLALVKGGGAHITRGLHDIGSASGVDIGAAMGTPVVAAFDGKVDYYICKSFDGAIVSYGAVAFQYADDGKYVATYAHLSQFDNFASYAEIASYPSRQQYSSDIKAYHHTSYLSKGDLIGRVGNTGNSFGAHLHFGLMADGKAVDPFVHIK